MSSYGHQPTPIGDSNTQPPSYDEFTAKSQEYGFSSEILRPPSTSAPYPVSPQSVGLMPMPMPMQTPISTIRTNSPVRSIKTTRQFTQLPTTASRNYQRIVVPDRRVVSRPRANYQIRPVVEKKSESNPIPAVVCVGIAILLMVGFFTFLGLILRLRK